MHLGKTVDFSKNKVLSLEDVLDRGESVIDFWKNGFFEGEATDEPIEALNGESKSLLYMVKSCLEVEIAFQNLFILGIRLVYLSRCNFLLEFSDLELQTQFLVLKGFPTLVLLFDLFCYLMFACLLGFLKQV